MKIINKIINKLNFIKKIHNFSVFLYQSQNNAIYIRSFTAGVFGSLIMLLLTFFQIHHIQPIMLILSFGFFVLSIFLLYNSTIYKQRTRFIVYVILIILMGTNVSLFFYYFYNITLNLFLTLLFITGAIFISIDSAYAVPIIHFSFSFPLYATSLILCHHSHNDFYLIIMTFAFVYSLYIITNNHFLALKIIKNNRIQIKLLRELKKASKIKDEFISTVSHELRTPLNSIIGFTHILKNESLPETAKNSINIIGEASQHLKDLINEILDIQKIQLNKLKLSKNKNSLFSLLTEIYNIFIPLCTEKKIDFFIITDNEVKDNYFFDKQRLKQILINFISNSVKFTEIGFISLKVNVEIGDKFDVLSFTITDTGTGIPPNIKNKIFLPFTTNTSTTQNIEGIGLGLNISKNLINLMHGSVDLIKTDNSGTTFNISLPLAKAKNKTSKRKNYLKNKECLIVLKNTEEKEQIKNIIATNGGHVFKTKSNNHLADILKEKNFDFIVADFYNLNHNLAEILQNNKALKIILIKSIEFTHSLAKSYSNNFLFLKRPVFSHSLNEMLQQYFLGTKPIKQTLNLTHKIEKQNNFKNITILVAEDNQWNRTLLKSLLEPKNAKLVIAHNGQEAVDLFGTQKFDLVLMDIMMPILNGYEATKIIRNKEKILKIDPTPILGLTAKSFDEEEKEGYKAGLNGYIKKPIEPNKFYKILIQYLSLNAPSQKNTLNKITDNLEFANFLQELKSDEKLLTVFQKEINITLPQKIKELKEAINKNDTKNIEFIAHFLKNIILYLADDSLTQYFIDIEKFSHDKEKIFDLLNQAEVDLKPYVTIIQEANRLSANKNS